MDIWMGGGWGKLCPFQMSILINTFVACHKKFKIRIEEEPMTESVEFFIKLIHCLYLSMILDLCTRFLTIILCINDL